MFRKIVSFISVLIVLVSCIVVPAFASSAGDYDTEVNYVNALDYAQECYWEQVSSSLYYLHYIPITNDLPFNSFDMVLRVDAGSLTSVTHFLLGNTNITEITEVIDGEYNSDGFKYYYIRGNLMVNELQNNLDNTFYFRGSFSTGMNGGMKILSFRFYDRILNDFVLPRTNQLIRPVSQDSSSTISAWQYSFTVPSSETYSEFQYQILLDTKYLYSFDFIRFDIYAEAISVNSIVAMIGSFKQVLPFDISYIGPGTGVYNIDHIISVYVDTRSIINTTNDPYFRLDISGEVRSGERASVGCLGCTGLVAMELQEPELSWLGKIWNSITDGFSNVIAGFNNLILDVRNGFNSVINKLGSLFDDNGAGQQFLEQAQQQNQVLENAQQQIDSVQKPDLSNTGDISHIVDTSSTLAYGNVLSVVLSNNFVVNILMLMGTFMLAGYVLFGKK